jgi:hypothetical protein
LNMVFTNHIFALGGRYQIKGISGLLNFAQRIMLGEERKREIVRGKRGEGEREGGI